MYFDAASGVRDFREANKLPTCLRICLAWLWMDESTATVFLLADSVASGFIGTTRSSSMMMMMRGQFVNSRANSLTIHPTGWAVNLRIRLDVDGMEEEDEEMCGVIVGQ